MQRNYFIPTRERLDELTEGPLPLRFRRGPLVLTRQREIDLDTTSSKLEKVGATCRLILASRGEATLSLMVPAHGSPTHEPIDVQSHVAVSDLREALTEPSEALRKIAMLVDPSTLRPRLALEIERLVQKARPKRFFGPCIELRYDTIQVSSGGFSHVFGELRIRSLRSGRPSLDEFTSALESQYQLQISTIPKLKRAREILRQAGEMSHGGLSDEDRELTVLAIGDDCLALQSLEEQLELPLRVGSGVERCRKLLSQWLGEEPTQVTRLATLPAQEPHRRLEVWLAQLSEPPEVERVVWYPVDALLSRIGAPGLRHRPLLVALNALTRSQEALVHSKSDAPQRPVPCLPEATRMSPDSARPDLFFNGELSQLEFNARVVELAEDPHVPMLERLRFLAIVTRNLDELFMIRVATLKYAVAKGDNRPGADGMTALDQLNLISIRTRQLMRRQYRCLRESLLPELARRGVRLRAWEDLNREQQRELRHFFDEQVFPLLTPHALTISPGHPFPHISNLDFSLAAILRDPRRPDAHFAHVRIPSDLPRFVPVPHTRDFLPLENLIAANYGTLYPQHRVEEIYAFRVTRSGTLELQEAQAINLLDAVEREVSLRPYNGVLRVEIEQTMPRQVRELLLRELAMEKNEESNLLTRADLYETEGLVDLRNLEELAELEGTDGHYPPFTGATFDPGGSFFDLMTQRDVLVHHPYQTFDSTVERFIIEATQDPQVVVIKLTLYRAGSQSNILDALLCAASRGVDASVFVELKARFDEEINVEWAKRLEDGAIHVVHGLVGLKTHAKMALVVRRENGKLKRYAHIGSGNYNSITARVYTDVGLLTTDPDVTADVQDLFNELTGSSAAPSRDYRALLVAPTHMLHDLLVRIEREAEHASMGGGGRIRAKLNGLADRKIIEALYRASQAGVEIDLVVRGICLLRPGVPGLSDGIRVISVCPSEVQTAWGGRVGRNNPNKLYAEDIAETVMAAVGMRHRALWPELAVFATNPWKED